MDKRKDTLKVLYNIVKEETHPTLYHCTPREMILHSTFDWELISKHLELLKADGFVEEIQNGNSPSFSITSKGIEDLLQHMPLHNEILPFLHFKQTEEKESLNRE